MLAFLESRSKSKFFNTYLAYIIYQSIQSHVEKQRAHISLDRNLNTAFCKEDILSSWNSILEIYTEVK